MITVNDIESEREQMQEDLIALLDDLDITVGPDGMQLKDAACQIVVESMKRLDKKL